MAHNSKQDAIMGRLYYEVALVSSKGNAQDIARCNIIIFTSLYYTCHITLYLRCNSRLILAHCLTFAILRVHKVYY